MFGAMVKLALPPQFTVCGVLGVIVPPVPPSARLCTAGGQMIILRLVAPPRLKG